MDTREMTEFQGGEKERGQRGKREREKCAVAGGTRWRIFSERE